MPKQTQSKGKTKTTVKSTQTKKKTPSEKEQNSTKNPLVVLIFIFVTIGIGLLVVNWGSQRRAENKVNEPLTVGDVFVCHEASDCVAVPAGCCDCNNGGRNIAINKKYQQYFMDHLKTKCEGMMCAAVVSDDPSCSATPDCVEGLCQLK